MAAVIGVASENCKCPVELFGDDEAGQGVGQRHGSQRELQMSPFKSGRGPSAGRTDGEDDVLGALVAARAQPGGEGL